MENNAAVTQERQYLTFLMDKDQYSISIEQVKEIIAYIDVMKIPMLPEYVKGVINLRGHVVPVIDLALRFGKEDTQIGKLTCIIIIEMERAGKIRELGIMVDAVNEVISLAGENVEDRPEFGDDVDVDFIDGMGRVDDKFIVMLNFGKLLKAKDLALLEKAREAAQQMMEEYDISGEDEEAEMGPEMEGQAEPEMEGQAEPEKEALAEPEPEPEPEPEQVEAQNIEPEK